MRGGGPQAAAAGAGRPGLRRLSGALGSGRGVGHARRDARGRPAPALGRRDGVPRGKTPWRGGSRLAAPWRRSATEAPAHNRRPHGALAKAAKLVPAHNRHPHGAADDGHAGPRAWPWTGGARPGGHHRGRRAAGQRRLARCVALMEGVGRAARRQQRQGDERGAGNGEAPASAKMVWRAGAGGGRMAFLQRGAAGWSPGWMSYRQSQNARRCWLNVAASSQNGACPALAIRRTCGVRDACLVLVDGGRVHDASSGAVRNQHRLADLRQEVVVVECAGEQRLPDVGRDGHVVPQHQVQLVSRGLAGEAQAHERLETADALLRFRREQARHEAEDLGGDDRHRRVAAKLRDAVDEVDAADSRPRRSAGCSPG